MRTRHTLTHLHALTLVACVSLSFSPSLHAGGQLPGDCNQDGSLDLTDAVCVLDHLFVGRVELPCASTQANAILLDANGKNGVDLTDAVLVLNHLFSGGPAPVLGRGCVEIAGCPNNCQAAPPAEDEPEVMTGVEGGQRTVRWQLAEGPQALVTYDIIDGFAVTEGDIILGTAEELASLPDATENTGGVQVRSVVVGRTRTWPDGIVPFSIPNRTWGDSTATVRQRISAAMDHVEENTNVRFVRRNGESEYIQFKSRDRDCSAEVGYKGRKQDVALSTNCGVGAIIHELAHAVGVWHEQSRCDRDDFVEILWDNIRDDKDHNFNKHCSDGVDFGDYDFDSIMHYGPTSFGKIDPDTGRRLETIRSKVDGVTFGMRNVLSDGDIAGINWLYPTPADERAGTIGTRTDTYDWTSGWTTAKAFTVGDEDYLFLLKASTGEVRIHSLEAFDATRLLEQTLNRPNFDDVDLGDLRRRPFTDGPTVVDVDDTSPLLHSTVGDLVVDYDWTSGWNNVDFYTLNGRTYLMLLKESDGRIHIHRMNGDGTVGARTMTSDWTSGWTTMKPFQAGFRQFLFLLKEGSGRAKVLTLRDDGTVGPSVVSYDWSRGWTSAEFYRAGGSTYLFLLKESTGDVHVHAMLSNGRVGSRTDTWNWTNGWSTARTYEIDGASYLFLLKKTTGVVHVHALDQDGTVGEELWRYSWAGGWTTAEFFTLGGRTYVLVLKALGGIVHVHAING